ncbi:carbohydrate-binding protein [Algibacter amylolyticus]|uniref:Carbohydrate-binding protein n=1 Tax=Algibacter amylolyticus TaxID=1608400 RepID=A0A5M7B6P4_9FLAO|nr:carbohydrate-binding protein [Algibacter amylolyticus]KAA5825206.1 carbohydrate-binding protein [Algibacter amylolyticus]MBB5268672.1 parallel beta-helix repeat protein [Algibacter amylolyticus]TSJ77700.1 carbohydrate-binding protein [Algibacter amylolyticus]
MKKIKLLNIVMVVFLLSMYQNSNAQTVVSSLDAFKTAIANSNQDITLQAGNYNLEDLASGSRVITFSGSNNTITLTNVHIEVPVGSIRESYILVTGNNNIINGGEIEDTYRNGLTEITDFVAYHQDSANLAYGLKGAAVMTVSGTDNLVDGLKLTVRGSHLYGYGSMYGINQYNTFGMNKRCGLLINGPRNTLDHVEVQMRAFGHGIFMQGEADETVIKNSLVEGRVRAYADLYSETDPNSFPFRSDYKLPGTSNTEYDMPFSEDVEPIPTDQVFSLSEDGIRSYTGTGSVTVENCTVKKMRGGIRLYLGNNCSVTNSTAIDCGSTNFNMPSGGTITSSSGNFAYAPLSDFRLGRNNMDIEWTIIPSPHATGPHNLADVQGSGHNIVFHRTDGPIDAEERAIVITGNNSIIINETEYNIVLEAGTSGNVIYSCGGGMVTDNGTNNTVTTFDNCEDIDNVCPKTAALMEAECYDSMSGVQTETCAEGGLNIGYINNDNWVRFEGIDLNGAKSVHARTAGKYDGGTIEVRLGDVAGTLIATIPVSNRGGWQSWGTDSVDIPSFTEGVYDVYFVFKSARSGSIFNINWFSFSEESLSVSSNALLNNLSIFPNPSDKEITVSLNNTGLEISQAKIILYNITGQEVLAVKPQNSKKITLDVSHIKSGVYFLQVSDNFSVITKKVVKL